MLPKDDVGFLIKLIHDGIDRVFHQEVGRNGPTRSQLNVLGYLSQHTDDKVLVKDIMDYLRIDQSTASGIVKRMEKNGYIITGQDPEDRRQKIVTLGPAGEKFSVMEAHREAARIEGVLLEGLSREEQKELRRMLHIIYGNLLKQ